MSSWRVKMPAIMGPVAGALLAWERHNDEVIASMGMAWDTGAPVWPYQTPEILLAVLNFPAYLLAAPVWLASDRRMHDERRPLLLFVIVFF